MLWLIILNTVKITANAFPSSSSSVRPQGISNRAVHFSHSPQKHMPHALSNNPNTKKLETAFPTKNIDFYFLFLLKCWNILSSNQQVILM